jgi:hypothetical protein
MKRNWDTIRKILLFIESSNESNPDVGYILKNTGIEINELYYHNSLLYDAGIIVDQRLSFAGHDFIDLIRNDDFWNHVKKTAEINNIGITIDLIKSLHKEFSTQS